MQTQTPTIVADRHVLTDRAARWATFQVGRHGRAVSAVADDLGCDWHTVNDAVMAYGQVLVDDPDRIAEVTHLGMDEACQARVGRYRTKRWSSQIVGDHRLLDVVEGRDAKPLCDWLAARGEAWRAQVATVTIDMAASYLSVAHTMLAHATVVADPFHVVKNANERLDECRRRVQQQTLQRRGHRDDPLYRSRRVLVMADERLSDTARARRERLLDRGDPHGEVRDAWMAKEAVRELYTVTDPDEAARWVADLATDMQDPSYGEEVRKLGRTLTAWGERIAAWHRTRASNAATEAINNLAKRVKRVAFGIINWTHWRTRVLLYAGGCDWTKLATLTPLPPRSRAASAP